MATKKHVGTENAIAQAAEVVGNAAEIAISELKVQLQSAEDALNAEKRLRLSEQAVHETEVKRLMQLAEHLQRTSERKTVPATAEGALTYILAYLEPVALGGSAADLRRGTQTIAGALDHAGRQTLNEYAVRLRGAAEAVVQELAAMLV